MKISYHFGKSLNEKIKLVITTNNFLRKEWETLKIDYDIVSFRQKAELEKVKTHKNEADALAYHDKYMGGIRNAS